MKCFLQQRFRHVSSKCCRYFRMTRRILQKSISLCLNERKNIVTCLHHIRHPLFPGDSNGVDCGGTSALHLVGLLPEGLHQVRHVSGVLLVDLGQLIVKVTD